MIGRMGWSGSSIPLRDPCGSASTDSFFLVLARSRSGRGTSTAQRVPRSHLAWWVDLRATAADKGSWPSSEERLSGTAKGASAEDSISDSNADADPDRRLNASWLRR
jgi:hypothetical protein